MFGGQVKRACTRVLQSVVNAFLFVMILFLKPLLTVFPQVVEVELAGKDASNCEKETDRNMASWMIILLSVAGAVGLFLMLLACCCVSYISLLSFKIYKSSCGF